MIQRIEIATKTGKQTIKATVTEGVAVHNTVLGEYLTTEESKFFPRWTVTHVKSGQAFDWTYSPQVARRLQRMMVRLGVGLKDYEELVPMKDKILETIKDAKVAHE